MTDALSIRDAAERALRNIGRAATISEIHAEIQRSGLFQFNTPTPEHVLRTTIRRHTSNVDRVDSADLVLFSMIDDEVYALNTEQTPRPPRTSTATGIKRIHRATDKEEIIKLMTSEQLGVFKEIWRLLTFAAQVGYHNKRREPLRAIDAGKGIDQSTFGNSPAWPGVVFLISLADAGAADVLGGSPENEEIRLAAFQEYANGGLAVLQEFFSSRPANLDGLIDFIDVQRMSPRAPPDLELSI
jgi:dnd system-associated protein 4